MPAPGKGVSSSCTLALWLPSSHCFSVAKRQETYSCGLSSPGSSPCMTAKPGARHSTGHVLQSGLEGQGAVQGAWSGKTSHADWSLGKSQRPQGYHHAISHPREGFCSPQGMGCGRMLMAGEGWLCLAVASGLLARAAPGPSLAHRPLIRLSSLSLPR